MKESWLEIYKVPKDTWVKEMEAAVAAVARSRKPTMVESSAPVSSILSVCCSVGYMLLIFWQKENEREELLQGTV